MDLPEPIEILLADDDPDDRLLATDALKQSNVVHRLHTVEDGEQLLEFVRQQGQFANAPRPHLILLDLNMPRKDGREALAEIKREPRLSHIPVVIMTTSNAADDVKTTYADGGNSYIVKPVTFDALVYTMKTLGEYWFKLVRLPNGKAAS